MSGRGRLWYVVLGAVLGAGPVVAQTPTTPTEVVERFLEANRQRYWLEAASYLHLPDILEMRREELARPSTPRRAMTADDIQRAIPDMPRAVAEWQAEQAQRARTRDVPRFHHFPTVETPDSLAALAPEVLAAAWLEGMDPITPLLEGARKAGCSITREFIDQLVPRPVARVLGAVTAHQDTAWVLADLARWRSGSTGYPGKPSLITLVRQPDGWKVRPDRQVLDNPGGLVGIDPELCSRPRRPPE